MKKLFLFSLILLVANFSQAQWEPDVRLTNDPANSSTYINNARCVAVSGDTVHIVWQDNRDGNDEIYYKNSIDGGITWGQDIRLTNDVSNSWSPSISVTGITVHVAWEDYRDGNSEIYYKNSVDGGTTWKEDTRLTIAPYQSFVPSLASSGSSVNIVWYDYRDLQFDIYYKRSIDGGLTWGPDVRLTYEPANSLMAAIAVSESDIYVVWAEYRDGNGEVYFKHSSDGGDNWGEDTRLTNDNALSRRTCVAVSGSDVHVVWQDLRNGDLEIYYKRSDDKGLSWGADTRLTNSIGDSYEPSIAVSGSAIHVVWYDNRSGDMEIYYKRSDDEGLNWGADTRLTDTIGDSKYPSIAVSGPVVHIVWTDLRDGNEEIYYKRDPTGGFPVGTDNFDISNRANQFLIWPNPASGKIHIDIKDFLNENPILSVWNILGEELLTSYISNGESMIDVSTLQNGFYFVNIATNKKFVNTKRLIIAK